MIKEKSFMSEDEYRRFKRKSKQLKLSFKLTMFYFNLMSSKYYTMEFIINDIVYVSLREKIDVLDIESKVVILRLKDMTIWGYGLSIQV